jgi:hypothetical protein
VAQPTYWLDLFSHRTWSEFLNAGGTVTGFRASRWKTAQQIKAGDRFLCYLTGVSRWIGLLEVTGRAYRDDTPIWSDDAFPVRLPVKLLLALDAEVAVPIMELRDELSIFRNLTNPHAWTGRLRGSPVKWSNGDGAAIVAALQKAQAKPVQRPLDKMKLRRKSPIFKTDDDRVVTIPDEELDDAGPTSENSICRASADNDLTAHLEVQWLLAKLGSDMGLSVWVARNDRNRQIDGKSFMSLPRAVVELPVQFDGATRRIVELIDVLWLKGQAIVAAFEIESTTSIYSGLLRMSDLISLQPNLAMPLYIVAPDERRSKVKDEITRPTFSRLPIPLSDLCRYIAFSALRENLAKAGPYVKHLNPQFLDDFAEVCGPDAV